MAELLLEWQEVLLQCNASADNSADLINVDTGESLTTALINSGLVTLRTVNSDDSATSESITTNKRTQHKLDAGDLGAQCSVFSYDAPRQVYSS